MNVLTLVIWWYLIFFLFGIMGLPISHFFFKKWSDKGYAFAKTIGLFYLASLVWVLCSFRIVSYNSTVLWIIFAICFLLSLSYLIKTKFKLNKLIIIEEIIFFSLLLIISLIRSTRPSVQNIEGMMNFGILSTINKSSFFPVKDFWLAGEYLNYYYLGHYIFALPGKMLHLDAKYVFNLANSVVSALSAVSFLSLSLELNRKFKGGYKYFGAAAALLIGIFGGNWLLCPSLLKILYIDIRILPIGILTDCV